MAKEKASPLLGVAEPFDSLAQFETLTFWDLVNTPLEIDIHPILMLNFQKYPLFCISDIPEYKIDLYS